MHAIEPAAAPPAPRPPASSAPVTAAVPNKDKKKRRRRPLVRNLDDSRLYNLMLDVHALQSEVQRLETSRDLMAARALVTRENQRGAMLSVSSQVFQAFRHGYQPQQWRPSQQAVVAAAFDDQVAISDHSTGVASLLEQWRMYSELFRMGEFVVSSLRVLVSDTDEGERIVEALGEFDGRMTHAALAVVFPHVVGHRALEQLLVGRAFCCPTRTMLHFDGRGRITRFGANAELLTAISQLVGRSPQLAAALMTHARINEASMIVVDGDEDGDGQGDEGGESSTLASDDGEAFGTNRQSVAYILS